VTNFRWTALALVGVAAISAAAWRVSPVRRVREWRNRVALLAELQPVVLKNCTLKRVGGPNAGGYLLCDNLSDAVRSVYSYGIGPQDRFGCDVSKQFRVPVHQYDCFDPGRPACEGGVFVFHDECIGPRADRDDAGRVYDTLQNQLARNLDTGKRLIVKMDIEGAEWDSLLVTPDDVLDQIDQMAMELHGVNEQHYLELVRRLKQKFYLVNLNFNNFACTSRSSPLPAWAFEVLWVNKRIGVLDEAAPAPAPRSTLNAPDNTELPDCQLSAGR
jgi:hypothetical protein